MRTLTPALALALVLGLVACGGAANAPEPKSAKPKAAEQPKKGEFAALKDDATRALPSGAKLGVPKGWWLKEIEGGLAFQDPEREITISLLEIDAPSTEAAAKIVMTKLGKTLPGKVLREVHDVDVAGWDEVAETVYETTGGSASGAPPSEQRVFAVNLRRRGEKVWATLLEGKAPAFARRGAQVGEIVLGLKVPGVAEEDLSAKAALPLDAQRLAAFETFMESAREKTHVPGMAIAVVQDGKIVFEKGFGVRERGKKEPVTERTRFMIGSVTKSLSTLLVASLVDQGKLKWDTKVTELLPTFKTGDAELTKQLTVAHTFCACTGMPRRDLDMVFEYATRKPDEVFTAFADVKPTTAMGETFQYSNQMTALGGFLAARVAQPGKPVGAAYAEAMKANVFAPMGMEDTTASFEEGKKPSAKGGVATPHGASYVGVREDAMILPIAAESFVNPVAPAGAVFSTAHDMARYALVELAKGKTPEGKQAFKEEALLERRKTRVKVGAKGGYGLGLATSSLRGLDVVTHDGGTFGFVTRFMLLPEKNLGLVVLTNSTAAGASLVDAATEKLIELAFDAKPQSAKTLDRALQQDQEEWARQHARVGKPLPEALAQKLVGTWKHGRLGSFTVTNGKEGLKLDVGEWSSRMGYEKSDDGTERLFFVDPPVGGLPVTLEKPGEKGGALVLQLGQETYRLEKK